MFHSLIIRYTELRISHVTPDHCPFGYGSLHPAIAWEEWVAWKWYLGGLLDRAMLWLHRVPYVRFFVCALWCDHLEMIRGPWSPVRSQTFEIPWERAPHPEARWREGMA